MLAISNSGESDELTAILPVLKRLGVPLVAMTGKPGSTLARHADIVLDSGVEKEACPLNLAPTASTTAQLALGDALAVALLDARGFREEDFARSHPGGALGRKLLTHVQRRDAHRRRACRASRRDASFAELMREMSAKGLGATAVVDDGRARARHLHRRRPAPPDRDAAPTCARCAPRRDARATRARSAPTRWRSRPPS